MADAGGLDVLISTEARLASQMAAAQAEARAVGQAARAEVEVEESRYALELASGAAVLASRIEARCQAEIVRLEAEAEAEVRRFEMVPAGQSERLVALVVRRVLSMWSSEAAP